MILPIKSQGFPNALSTLGVQSPLQGPFWGFESTVLPTIEIASTNVRSSSGVPYVGRNANLGVIATPAANATLANSVVGWMPVGFWAIRATWYVLNTTVANGTTIELRRVNAAFVTQDFETMDLVTASGGQKNWAFGSRDIVLWNPEEGNQFVLVNVGNLPTAGSVAFGILRWRYLGSQINLTPNP